MSLTFEIVEEKDENFAETLRLIQTREMHQMCKNDNVDVIVREYIVEEVESGNIETIIVMSKDDTRIGFCTLRFLHTTATLDIFCNKSNGRDFLKRIEEYVRDVGKKALRLYAVASRVIYFRRMGFIISHASFSEKLVIKRRADEMMDQRIANNNDVTGEYKDFLQFLIHEDMLRDHILGKDLKTLKPLVDDSNGYAMIKPLV